MISLCVQSIRERVHSLNKLAESTESFAVSQVQQRAVAGFKHLKVMLIGCDSDDSAQIIDCLQSQYRVLVEDRVEMAGGQLTERNIAVVICEEALAEGQSGLSLLAELHRQHPLVQPILLSEAIGEELLMVAVNDIGALKYLRKPLQLGELQKVVASAAALHRQALEIEAIREEHRELLSGMHGLAYRQRQLQRQVRMTLRYARDLLLASIAIVLIVQAVFLALSAGVLLMLYLLKSALGLDFLSGAHLRELLFG